MKLFKSKKEKMLSFAYALDKLVEFCYFNSVFMDEQDFTKKDILINIISTAKHGYSENKHE